MAYKMKGYSYPGKSPAKHGTTDDFLYGRNGHNPDIMEGSHEDWHGDRIELTPEEKIEKGEIKEKPSPNKQKPKKSTESAHGQLGDAEREYQEDLKRVKMTKSEEGKGRYWYKINGKKATKAEYIKYQNKPGGDEPGKQTNDPDASGNKAKIARDRASNTKINKK